MRSTCESTNENLGQDGNCDDESDLASSLLDVTTTLSEQGGPTLFDLARDERWEDLLDRLENTPPNVVRDQTDASGDEDDSLADTILHVVSGMERVPVKVVEKILSRILTIESSIASLRNGSQQTPLHIAVFSIPERTDVIERLYHACPENVQARDSLRLRPIDIITERIIMLEEVIKYSTREEVDWDAMIERFWESVGVLVGASKSCQCSTDNHSGDPATSPLLLHACLRSKDVPFALTDRAMKHKKFQLELTDENGDLPLHIVSRIVPPAQQRARNTREDDEMDEEDDINDDGEGDFLNRILSSYPKAAAHYNKAHQLPLIVAIESGRKWNSGISRLLEVNPSAIQDAQLPLNVFPFLFERLSGQPHITFRILQSLPDLFLYN